HRLTVASGIVRIEPLAEGSSPGSAHALADRGPANDALALNAPERATGRAADHDQARFDRELDAEASAAPSRASEQADSDRPSRHRHRRHKVRGGRGKTALADAGSSGASDDTWLDLAERGAYPEALAAAQRIGWSSLCLRLDAHRLLTLADVARYSNARGPARQAFEALVKRFPDDRLAADAVFSLGRLAFEGGNPPVAARWFRRYVTDWPNGPLAEQAAGRLVETTIRMEDSEAARSAARAYLARAPHGAQAALARGVLAEPSDGAP
ncbi:MAG TPA: tetratricopeptide repeat protein, partial [Polyangia bacterium]|nr:tetratricopeptide repeat protein [Polyangia bacterium]